MINLGKTDFGHVFARPTEQADPELPRGHLARAAARRTAMLAEAAQVLAVLPGPGEALHALMTGRYDLTALLVALFDRLGPCREVRIATLSYNLRNVAELLKQIDARKIGRLTLLCSLFFKQHNPEIWTAMQDGLADRPGGHRQAAARSHAKVVCLHFRDRKRFVLEGSANLRTNSNQEQFCLVRSAGLHDWHGHWIDDMVTRYAAGNESNESRAGKTG
jgi:hypothetical protein